MHKGTVVALYIAPAAAEPMMPREEVRALPGKGIEGDRYCNRTGTFSNRHSAKSEVTLVEREALEALESNHKIKLSPAESRRNIITSDISLNDLVDHEFRVGEVTLRGLCLCEPCLHLAKLVQRDIVPGLVHRGGLRAQILTEGMIRVGDSIEENP